LDVTLARVKAILGEENVGCAVLEDTHAPEPYRMEPFTVPSNESAISASERSRTALRQLRPPEAISVTLRDSKPAHFWFRDRRYMVEQAYGPWRVSGDWWNSTLWGMDQWDLVARGYDGAMLCCSMLRDLMHKEWQMAGFYD
jgi:protein ImuB